MRAIGLSFLHMLKLIRHDMMLFAAGLAPLLAGVAIRFGVPFVEKMLVSYTGEEAVLTLYYGLFDIFFASIAPAMFGFIAAMVMLEEHDDHIDRYLFITGLGRSGYLVSRIMIPALGAFVITAALLPVFRLSELSAAGVVLLALTGTMQGIIIVLLIVALSSNKLEGMAITKLSALMIMGAVVPYFVPKPVCYCLSILPSFWIGKAVLESALIYMMMAALIAGIWILVLLRVFGRSR
ncbi:MAG: ABC transporter permease [Lachnospiraceae bacterium]